MKNEILQIIQELTRHDRLGHFTNEFQRLIDCLKECYVKEQELIERNRTLRSQIDNNVFKQLELSKSLQSEREVIDKLQKVFLSDLPNLALKN